MRYGIRVWFTAVVLFSFNHVQSQSTDLIEQFSGDLPLYIAIEHGGWKTVGAVPVGPSMSDTSLREFTFRYLLPMIYHKTGRLPYYLFHQGRRDYVNCNRFTGDPEAYGSPEAEAAYIDYHNRIDSVVAMMESRFGNNIGFLINPHTSDLPQNLNDGPWDRIAEIGFGTSVLNIESQNNTMASLFTQRGWNSLCGPESVPYLFYHGNNWPNPDAVWPLVATTNSKELTRRGEDVWHVLPAFITEGLGWVSPYYTGEATILYHGTNPAGHHLNWIRGLDAFQIEFNILAESGLLLNTTDPEYDPAGAENQLDPVFAWQCADNFIDGMLMSLQLNYSWTPSEAYMVIVDNDSDGFSKTGIWRDSTGLAFWGPNPSVYTQTSGDSAIWTPNLLSSGLYEVFVRWTKAATRTSNALYTIHHDNGDTTRIMDQNGSLDARWNSLGQFEFSAGNAGYVTLTAQDGYPTCADAVLFRQVSIAPVPDNLPPNAVISVQCGEPIGSGSIGMFDSAVFDSSMSIDPDGSIVSHEWDFGDGGVASGPHVIHLYDRSGVFTVRVTTRDNSGAEDTESTEIQIIPCISRVDNDQVGFQRDLDGHWSESDMPGSYGTRSIEAVIPGSYVTWTCNLADSGDYEVSVRWTSHPGRCTDAEYSVVHDGGETSILTDQTSGGGEWNVIGTFHYAAGSNATIRLTGAHDERSICADAVQWYRIPANPSLRLHLGFDQVIGDLVPDSSEFRNDGQRIGATWIPDGISNGALSFDGADDYIVVDTPLTGNFPFSYSLWLRTTLPITANRRIIEIANRSGQSSAYSMFISYGDPCIGGIAPGMTWTSASSNFNVNDGYWHHIAAVFAAPSDKRLYVDGILKASLTESLPFSSEVDAVTIGRDGDSNPNPERFFQGDLDEVMVFNRELTLTDIQSLALTPTPTPSGIRTATPTRTPTPSQTSTHIPSMTPTHSPGATQTATAPQVPATSPSGIVLILCVLSVLLMFLKQKQN